LENLLWLQASTGTPGIRHDAIGAMSITSILDLQKGPGKLGKSVDWWVLKSFSLGDRAYLDKGPIPFLELEEKLSNLFLFPVAQDIIHPGNSAYFVRIYLGITSGNNYQGLRIFPLKTSDQLAGLIISFSGNCAGIYDVNIGRFISRNYLHIGLRNTFFNKGRIELVSFASECGNDNFLHLQDIFSPAFPRNFVKPAKER